MTLLIETMGDKVKNGGEYVGKGVRGYSEEEVREVLPPVYLTGSYLPKYPKLDRR